MNRHMEDDSEAVQVPPGFQLEMWHHEHERAAGAAPNYIVEGKLREDRMGLECQILPAWFLNTASAWRLVRI